MHFPNPLLKIQQFFLNNRLDNVTPGEFGALSSKIRFLPQSRINSQLIIDELCKIREWLSAAIEDGIEIHEPEDLDEYSGQFKLRLPKRLHKTLAEDSKKEGVSMNQYCVYLLAKNSAEEHIVLSAAAR